MKKSRRKKTLQIPCEEHIPRSLEKEISAMKERTSKILSDIRGSFESMKSQNNRFLKEAREMLKDMNQKMSGYSDLINSVKSTNENVEDTILNVLAAIRQNEYLQAWYPEQSGMPEMKVIGSHPLSSKSKLIRKQKCH